MSIVINRGTRRKQHVPQRYVPRTLTRRDKEKQLRSLKKSRSLYKKGKYYARPSVSSFTSKKSSHIETAKRLYSVDKIGATRELSKKSGCSVAGLREIIRKGEGAYYSSGSRPNQTAFSWGVARLASALTGGPASRIDRAILEKSCSINSVAMKKVLPPTKQITH